MDRNYLIQTAKKLSSVSQEAAKEFRIKSDELISKMNEAMLQRPDIEKMVGADNLSMMKDNHANHNRFITSIMEEFNAEVMVDTVLWVFDAYQNHGFSSQYWAAQLNTWIALFKEVLSEGTFKEIEPFYVWMQTNIPIFVKISGSGLGKNDHLPL